MKLAAQPSADWKYQKRVGSVNKKSICNKNANSHQLHYRGIANPRRKKILLSSPFCNHFVLISSLLVATHSHLAPSVCASFGPGHVTARLFSIPRHSSSPCHGKSGFNNTIGRQIYIHRNVLKIKVSQQEKQLEVCIPTNLGILNEVGR